MLNFILKSFKKHPSIALVEKALKHERNVTVHGLGGSSGAFFAAALLGGEHKSCERSVLAVFPEEEEAEAFRDDVEAILGSEKTRYFPARDTNPYEHADSHFEVRSQRVETLDMLERGWKGVVIAAIGALHDPTTPPGLIELISVEVKKGKKINFDNFVKNLIVKGFKRRNTVSSAGEVAVRGGIVDIFPFGGDIPYRIEFWGDEIESIRTFSTSSQRSLEEVGRFRIIPPDEFITEAGLDEPEKQRIREIEQKAGLDLGMLRRVFEDENRPEGIEQYLFTVFGSRAALSDHFSENDVTIVTDPERCINEVEKRLNFARTEWERQRHDENNLPSPEFLFQSPASLMEGLAKNLMVNNYYLRPTRKNGIEFFVSTSRQYQGNLGELKKDIQEARKKGMNCHIVCDNTGQVERLDELLDEIIGDYAIDVARLTGGFISPDSSVSVFTDHEIFSRYRRRVRYRRFKEGVPIPDHRTLTLGDYVVHVDYGIGRFMGLKRDTIGGAETDCLLIEYRGDDQLLLPVGKLEKLKKFSSEEGVVPVVSKLGGTSWEKLKARTKKSIRRMAGDLLRLYAERKTYPGFSFKPDEHMMRSLEESFVYEETPDQQTTWAEVRTDMESTAPMERLICGDVGFGKTEIAMRAAFLAVLNGKQAAVLVPTTILAEQHERTFRERFADFPVKIDSLSRFRSTAEQKRILERLSLGDVDIIIGTHRLLSKDVHIKDIGVLIIDEEQRFGVRHKERLKKIRRNVDVLAMSATPIPRTINMSLSGARDISYINTPPRDRYSVHTEIMPFEERHIVEAITREIDRDGQVFFVHNRVRSISSMTSYLKKLLPNVTFGIGHGQLPEKALEKVMRDFHNRKFQVLVSTMIIENGLDIPSVNTIIINRADTFGLAQLYQLRGRVGRSNRRAYAYLLIPPKMSLNKTARQRLRTIEEFAELGSGFNIAMRDLEIRGAGNILGTDQSGFISAVGFDMFMELLRETIAELRGEKVEKPPEVEIHIKKDAYIPDDYVPDPTERVLLYRRLSEALTTDEVKAIEEEVLDRYGRMGEPVVNLLDTAYLRHYADAVNVSDLSISDGEVSMFIPEGIEMTREAIEKMVKKSPVKLNFSFHNGMRIDYCFPEDSRGPLSGAKNILQAMCS